MDVPVFMEQIDKNGQSSKSLPVNCPFCFFVSLQLRFFFLSAF